MPHCVASHAEKVEKTVQSRSAAGRSWIAASWRRSYLKHGLDPSLEGAQLPNEGAEFRRLRERHDRLLTIAAPRLDMLFSIVGNTGCGVVLTDKTGIVLDQRYREADVPEFRRWGLWRGADWSEGVEGTNGIGTCISESRPIIVHRDEHFYARNIGMSCIDVPIYGYDGRLKAALDVSSARTDQTEPANAMIAALVAQTARQIETDCFRAAFPQARIVFAEGEGLDSSMLFAIDDYDMVVGATRAARKAFGCDLTGTFEPRPATEFYQRNEDRKGFDLAGRAVLVRTLARAGGNASQAARMLGIGRATLYRRMKRFGIE
ncbi:MAG: GAF domain-containing protein [Pseudomonadota bacterium]